MRAEIDMVLSFVWEETRQRRTSCHDDTIARPTSTATRGFARRSAPELGVADLLEPVDGLAAEAFLESDMGHDRRHPAGAGGDRSVRGSGCRHPCASHRAGT